MVKCENLSRTDIDRIGEHIADAFLGEPGAFQVLSRASAVKLFRLIADTCYQCGHLYTTGPQQEGYCVYWTKSQRPGLWAQLKMGVKMLGCMTLKEGMALSKNQNGWIPTEKRYKNSLDFVEVFLLAVRKDCQGQGHFRRIMAEPFALAEQRGTICVLDTDSQTKVDKYTHAGMHLVDSKATKGGVTMYAMEK